MTSDGQATHDARKIFPDAMKAVSKMTHEAIPAWTLGWRLQRALDFADIKAGDMAAELGVTRSTVSRWMHDSGAPPRPIYLRQWALRCGVPYEWLAEGEPLTQGIHRYPIDTLGDAELMDSSPASEPLLAA